VAHVPRRTSRSNRCPLRVNGMALIDGVVCAQDGAPGSAKFGTTSTGVVALWGMLGMTSGKYF
jgi:hypothetical protein